MTTALAAEQTLRTRSALAVRAQALALVAIGWGALAFGGAYPWAYWPLAALMFGAGAAGWLTDAGATNRVTRTLVMAFALPAAAVALQLIPLPLAWVRALSPNLPGILENTDFAFGAGLVRLHAVSVDKTATLVPFLLFASAAVLVIGLARTMAVRHPRTLVEGLTVVGVDPGAHLRACVGRVAHARRLVLVRRLGAAAACVRLVRRVRRLVPVLPRVPVGLLPERVRVLPARSLVHRA